MARQSASLIDDPVVQRLSREHDTTLQTILLSYGVSKGVSVIPKSQLPEHLRQNYQCLFRLSYRDLEALDSIEENGRTKADGFASENGSEGR
jgi:diketogulonate reductase-like aldo/keto reductase